MQTPNGLDEIKALYGDPALLQRDDGTVSPIWELRMVRVRFPGPVPLGWGDHLPCSGARVNEAIAVEVTAVFSALQRAGLWDHIVTFDGAYAWRAQRGSNKLSMHAFGGALDFNAATNQLGTKGDMHPDVVACFEARGWEWGGRWHRPDCQHFQMARGY